MISFTWIMAGITVIGALAFTWYRWPKVMWNVVALAIVLVVAAVSQMRGDETSETIRTVLALIPFVLVAFLVDIVNAWRRQESRQE